VRAWVGGFAEVQGGESGGRTGASGRVGHTQWGSSAHRRPPILSSPLTHKQVAKGARPDLAAQPVPARHRDVYGPLGGGRGHCCCCCWAFVEGGKKSTRAAPSLAGFCGCVARASGPGVRVAGCVRGQLPRRISGVRGDASRVSPRGVCFRDTRPERKSAGIAPRGTLRLDCHHPLFFSPRGATPRDHTLSHGHPRRRPLLRRRRQRRR